MGIFDKFRETFGTQTEVRILQNDPRKSPTSKIYFANSEINRLVTDALMRGKNLSWHRVNSMVNTKEEADKICKKVCHELGINITYEGRVYTKW